MNAAQTVALVSGAGSGIGRATAQRFAQQGARLVMFDLDAAALDETRALCAGEGHKIHALDVTHRTAVEDALTAAYAQCGRLDVVVAAAGIAQSGWLDDMAPDAWRKIVEVNLFGTYTLARTALAALRGSGGGSFVALGSDAALRGVGEYSAYAASKHAVLGLVRSMALECAPYGIRCNAVCPGFVETPMADDLLKHVSAPAQAAMRAANPSGRFATPEEVAQVIFALTTPAFSYVTGAAIPVDGGLMAGAFPGAKQKVRVQ